MPLICFEGIDASGKSTQLEIFRKAQEHNDSYVFCCDPGSTVLGSKIREIVKFADFPVSRQSELLMFTASRIQLCEEIIIPALKEHKIVLCDRFLSSTLAYQGYGRGFDLKTINQMHKEFCSVYPDITFYFKISLDKWKERKHLDAVRRCVEDRFEDVEGQSFIEKVMKGYEEIEKEDKTACIVNGELSVSEVHSFVKSKIEDFLLHQYLNN